MKRQNLVVSIHFGLPFPLVQKMGPILSQFHLILVFMHFPLHVVRILVSRKFPGLTTYYEQVIHLYD